MKSFSVPALILLFLLAACEKAAEDKNTQYSAQIVGFDLNCSTCIVSFPDDSPKVKKLYGESPDDYYEVVNLNKGDFEIGQKLKVVVRKASDTELNPCITLYPSSNYKSLYVLGYEEYSNLRLNDTVDLAYKNCFF